MKTYRHFPRCCRSGMSQLQINKLSICITYALKIEPKLLLLVTEEFFCTTACECTFLVSWFLDPHQHAINTASATVKSSFAAFLEGCCWLTMNTISKLWLEMLSRDARCVYRLITLRDLPRVLLHSPFPWGRLYFRRGYLGLIRRMLIHSVSIGDNQIWTVPLICTLSTVYGPFHSGFNLSENLS